MPAIRGAVRLMCLLWFCAGVPAQAEMRLGANGHPLVSYHGVTFERQLDLLEDLGLTSYRVDILHADQADALAKLLSLAKPRGIEILPVITPAFDLNRETAEDLYTKSFELAVTLVSRFKTEIRVWELGNEMENYAIIRPCEMRDDGSQYPCEWGPAGGVGALDYYGPRWEKVSAVLKGLSDGTASVDPSIRRAIGTAGWGHLGAFERMKTDGIGWDISVWHMYGEDPEWAFKALASYKRPIWVTEFNNPLGSSKGEDAQAEGIKKSIIQLRELAQRYDVEAAHIYQLLDEPYWGDDFEAKMGLVRLQSDGFGGWWAAHPKAAYAVVKEMTGVSGTLAPPSRELASEAGKAIGIRSCSLVAQDTRRSDAAARVNYLYCLVLGRNADPQGLSNYAGKLSTGMPISTLILELLGSREFRARLGALGGTSELFVAAAYRLLLERTPDLQEFAHDVSRLNDGSMQQRDLIEGIIEGVEFQQKHTILFSKTETRSNDPLIRHLVHPVARQERGALPYTYMLEWKLKQLL